LQFATLGPDSSLTKEHESSFKQRTKGVPYEMRATWL